MIIFYVDTNVFIQCRDLRELPWGELTASSDDLLLLVPRGVCEEIDSFKADGNSRRSKRARKASALFRSALEGPEFRITLRDACPRVQLGFPPTAAAAPPLEFGLGRTIDDQIVGEALAHKAASPNDDVRFISHDTYPLLVARRNGLPVSVVPNSWLLPPEPDERDRKLGDLERRITLLEGNSPEIRLCAHQGDDAVVDVVVHRWKRFRALPPQEVERLLAIARMSCPLATSFSDSESSRSPRLGPPGRYEPPSEEEVRKYRAAYSGWLAALERYLSSLHEFLEGPERHVPFEVSIENTGCVPAYNVMIELEFSPGLTLAPRTTEEEDSEEQADVLSLNPPPQPPTAPVGRWRSPLQELANLPRFAEIDALKNQPLAGFAARIRSTNTPEQRDRHGFYWKGGRPGTHVDSAALECAEFRHQIEPFYFSFVAFVDPLKNPTGGQFRCRVTASNLPVPEELRFNFRFEEDHALITPIAEGCIHRLRDPQRWVRNGEGTT